MTDVFYITGVIFWLAGGLWVTTNLLWAIALKTMSNAGELFDFARFSVEKRRKPTERQPE